MFREMRRYKQELSREECRQILLEGKRGVLALLGDQDYPYTVPMNYVYDGDAIYFHGAKSGHKLDAIARHDKVSFCVLDEGRKEENAWWYHFRSVVCFGRLQLIEDGEEREKYLTCLGEKYFPTREALDREMEKYAANTAVLLLKIEHMTGKRVKEK